MENENAIVVILQCLEKRLAIFAYKCMMHVGREFLCKNDTQSAFFSSSDHWGHSQGPL